MTSDREQELLDHIEMLERTVAQLEEVIVNHSIAMLNQIGLSGDDADRRVYGPQHIQS